MNTIKLYDQYNREITRCKKCGAILSAREKLNMTELCDVCSKE